MTMLLHVLVWTAGALVLGLVTLGVAYMVDKSPDRDEQRRAAELARIAEQTINDISRRTQEDLLSAALHHMAAVNPRRAGRHRSTDPARRPSPYPRSS